MHEQYDERGTAVMRLANQEAIRFHHTEIDSEHILLALSKQGTGVPPNVINDLNEIRLAVEKRINTGSETVEVGQLPFSPRGKEIIELAKRDVQANKTSRETSGQETGRIGTENIFLALLRVGDGVAYEVLNSLGFRSE